MIGVDPPAPDRADTRRLRRTAGALALERRDEVGEVDVDDVDVPLFPEVLFEPALEPLQLVRLALGRAPFVLSAELLERLADRPGLPAVLLLFPDAMEDRPQVPVAH